MMLFSVLGFRACGVVHQHAVPGFGVGLGQSYGATGLEGLWGSLFWLASGSRLPAHPKTVM